MEKKIDLRGLICPAPVLKTKQLLDNGEIQLIEALVDSDINVKNLARLAKSMNAAMSCSNEGDHYKVVLSRSSNESLDRNAEEALLEAQKELLKQRVGSVVFISKDTFGDGDQDFSRNLLNIFLQTLLESGHRPRAILLANSGVKLMDPERSFLPVLEKFKEEGTEVMACGLCVEHYGLKEHIDKEQITNMFTICEYLMSADRVISP